MYLSWNAFSKDLATTYCLKQKKEKIGKVAKYLLRNLPMPKSLIGDNIFFSSLTTSKLDILRKLFISFKFKSCVFTSGILNLNMVAKLNIGDHIGE